VSKSVTFIASAALTPDNRAERLVRRLALMFLASNRQALRAELDPTCFRC